MKTGLNEAFVINRAKRDELIAADPRSAEVIKPLVVGNDVRRWSITKEDKFLIFAKRGIAIQEYPAVLAHLEAYYDKLSARATISTHPWYELQQPQEGIYHHFDNPKIVYPEISMDSRFSYDESGSYVNNKAFIIAATDLYLLGVLSSKIVWQYLQSVCSSIQGNALELKSTYLVTTPIPIPNNQTRSEIEALVHSCLAKKGGGCHEEEAIIEEKVRELYGL